MQLNWYFYLFILYFIYYRNSEVDNELNLSISWLQKTALSNNSKFSAHRKVQHLKSVEEIVQ